MKSGATPEQMWSQVPTANKIASVIKSIQRGTITIPDSGSSAVTATISAVVVAKSFISWLGYTVAPSGGTSTYRVDVSIMLDLTDTTTVTATPVTAVTGIRVVGYEVIEHY